MIKLATLRLVNAVKLGDYETTHFEQNKADMVMLEEGVILMRDKRTGLVQRTSLFNVISWTLPEDHEQPAAPKRAAERGSKKGSQQLEA